MRKTKALTIAFYGGTTALVIGLIVTVLNWNLWGGGMPGYKLFLAPGNLTLIYIWHPLFTEEIGFWPKLGLQMLGQFSLSFIMVWIIAKLIKGSE